MSIPAALQDFVTACQTHFGSEATGFGEDSLHVVVDGRIIQVNLDAMAGRAVLWTELVRPEHARTDALQRAALQHTSRDFLDHGFVLALHPGADLIIVGRSIEQDMLKQYVGLKLLKTVAEAAARADAALAKARMVN